MDGNYVTMDGNLEEPSEDCELRLYNFEFETTFQGHPIFGG